MWYVRRRGKTTEGSGVVCGEEGEICSPDQVLCLQRGRERESMKVRGRGRGREVRSGRV